MPDFKIDLHVHASERSRCSIASEAALIQAAIAAGLDAVVFSDHDRLVPAAHLAALNAAHAPFRIFGGIEISLPGEHALVFGVRDPALENLGWSYPHLHAFVRERGGFIALAHPFRYRSYLTLDAEAYPPDAVEGHSLNITPDMVPEIRALARRLNVPQLSNSDAHDARDVGAYYNRLPRPPADDADIIRMLRAGDFEAVHP